MNSKSLRLKTLKGAKATCVVEVLISAATSMKTTSKRPKKTTTLLEIGNHSNGVRGSRDALCKKDTGLTGGESAAFFGRGVNAAYDVWLQQVRDLPRPLGPVRPSTSTVVTESVRKP